MWWGFAGGQCVPSFLSFGSVHKKRLKHTSVQHAI